MVENQHVNIKFKYNSDFLKLHSCNRFRKTSSNLPTDNSKITIGTEVSGETGIHGL